MYLNEKKLHFHIFKSMDKEKKLNSWYLYKKHKP